MHKNNTYNDNEEKELIFPCSSSVYAFFYCFFREMCLVGYSGDSSHATGIGSSFLTAFDSKYKTLGLCVYHTLSDQK